MSKFEQGRAPSSGRMFCPGCCAVLAVPLGFEVPEILKCPSCDAQWVFLKMARNEIRAQLSAEYSLREKTA